MPNCNTCKHLIKIGGHRGKEAERVCYKGHFRFVPAKGFKPVENCRHYTKKGR